MQDQIKAKALAVATDVKKHWKVLVLASPLLIAPIFIAIVETLPVPPPKPVSITVTLPPATPYEATHGGMAIVPSQQLVQTETKIVYVQVPAKDGKGATVQPVVVQSSPPPPVPVTVQPEPSKDPILPTIFNPPAPKPAPTPAPRQVAVTPVEFGNSAGFQPEYPQTCRVANIEGTVHVRVTVAANGRPIAIRPLGPNNDCLFNAVHNYGLKHWRFKPATVDGVPSAGNIDVSLNFKLSDE